MEASSGVSVAGTDDVQSDAAAGELASQRFGEGDYAAFAGRVNGFARGAHAAGVRGNVHHASEPALGHTAHHDVMHVERAIKVDVDYFFPQFGSGIEKILSAIPAGDVREQFCRSGGGFERMDGVADPIVISDVDFVDQHLTWAGRTKGLGFLRPGEVQIENSDNATFFDQPDGGGASDTACAPGQDCTFSIEPPHLV